MNPGGGKYSSGVEINNKRNCKKRTGKGKDGSKDGNPHHSV